ncbi:MAG: DoxX family protein [Burkholderiales bacterium]|nr:DoxX family protein [Burkholderiales bacterium]
MSLLRDLAALVGRILIAVLFIPAGWGKITGFAGTAGYIASKGLPLPAVATAVAIAIELGGGLLLVAGYRTRWAAAALLAFTVATTFVFHPFWSVPADQVMATTINFWKNVAIIGGLLYVWAFGPGRLAIDRS